MKKSTLFLAVALLVTIGFYSCENKNNSLRGTTWLSEILIDIEGDEFQVIIKFINNTDCGVVAVYTKFVSTDYDNVYANAKYTYKHPNISIDYIFGKSCTGTINGNEMTLSMFDKDVIFIKQ